MNQIQVDAYYHFAYVRVIQFSIGKHGKVGFFLERSMIRTTFILMEFGIYEKRQSRSNLNC